MPESRKQNRLIAPVRSPEGIMPTELEELLELSDEGEDRASLGFFLSFQLSTTLGKGETEAAELAGQMIGKSDRTLESGGQTCFLNLLETSLKASKATIRREVCCATI